MACRIEGLVKRTRLGDISAFDELAVIARPAMTAAARGVLGCSDDVFDAVQEAMLLACKNLDKLADPSLAVSWMAAIARRRALRRAESPAPAPLEYGALDRLLKEKSQELGRPSAGPSLEETLEALQKLPPEDQRVISLAAWHELGSAELALRLGTTSAAAKWRLHAARGRLARQMSQPPHDPSHQESQ